MAATLRTSVPLKASISRATTATICRPHIQDALPRWPSLSRTHTPPKCGRRTFMSSRNLLEKKYTSDHEWIELSSDGKTGTIGISTYASAALGDVVYVELPALGLEISKGDSIGAVESVKSASDIMTPVSGKIIEANSVLEEKPGMINKGPEGEGWIARIEVGEGGRGEVEGLMGGEEYRKMVEE